MEITFYTLFTDIQFVERDFSTLFPSYWVEKYAARARMMVMMFFLLIILWWFYLFPIDGRSPTDMLIGISGIGGD